ncbi:MAG TPA: TonB-dependent receptor [Candidatus Acidoferrum sp.]|nr:TonB-dependent receptor [Candidatus Acidoferrum sp.]
MFNAISYRKFSSIFALLLLGLVLPARVFCQVDTGTISGTVKDSSGGVIPGATVTLINDGTGISISTASGSVGEYTFSPVKIGHYSLSAEIKGFQKVRQNNVTVDVQQKVVVDFALPVGQSIETVIVNTAPPALQTEEASVGQVVEAEAINALPLNGRNFTFLAQLSVGVTQGQQDTRGLGASGSFSANGMRPAQNNYLLDGMDNNTNLVDFLNGTAYVVRPPVDAIQEFKVQTDDYSAEMGRSGGAVLNATVKAGTNQFHGTVWEFIRNDKLDAANFFENAGGIPKGEYRQNQFGFTIGGPIRRGKTFFFADYEGTRIRQALTSTNTVPTALERSSGYTNLSELLTEQQGSYSPDALGRVYPLGQVFDPSTTRGVTCGVADPVTGITAPCTGVPAGTQIGFVREPFNGNMIPANRLDQNAIKLLNLYPAPTNSGLFNNYAADPISSNNTDQFDVRVDHTFSEKDNIFGRFSYIDNPSFVPGPFGGIADGGSFSDGSQTAKSLNAVVSETHVFSTSLVNEARAGYSRLKATRLQPNANTMGIPGQYGIQGVPQIPSNGGLGSLFITGLTTLGSNGFLPSIELSTNTQIIDNLTKTAGRESFRMGFTFQRLGFSILQPYAGRGEWSFSGDYTEVPSQLGGSTGLAQMLLTPIPATVTGASDYVGGSDNIYVSNFANTSMKHNYYGAYFQDDIKVTPKLTVNLGLRWEYFGELIENYGAQSNFLPSGPNGSSTFMLTQKRCSTPLSPDFYAAAKTDNINVVCSSQPGLGVAQKLNFAPRVGFAYQLTRKFVVRGGYGIFYGGFENSVVETYNDFPFQFYLDYPILTPNAPITFSNGAIGTLSTGLTAIPLTTSAVEPGGVVFLGEDYKNKTPYTQGYNLTVQYQLTPSDTIQLGYVGNTVRHLGVYVNPNTPREILPPGLNSYLYSPYPDFTFQNYTSFAADSNYNSLQANYERRLGGGLSVLGNFTWSKCLTNAVDVLNGTALTGFRAPFLPGFGIHKDFGECDFDVQKVLHLSGTYDLPVGRGRHFLKDGSRVVDAFIGGWDTNWILTMQDGQPGTIPCIISTTSGFGCNAIRVAGQNPYAGPHNVDDWLNAAAFTSPPVAATIGQTDYSPLGGGPSQFRGPGFHRLDFSLFKEFRTTERTHLEFRSEFFNLTNHPNFSIPGFQGNGVVAAPGSLDYSNPSTFGKIASTRDGSNDQREIQFALKFYF